MIIRYGEVQPPIDHDYEEDPPSDSVCKGIAPGLKKGSEVKKGQHIAYIGRLRLKNEKTGKLEDYHETMVHLEMYSGKAQGSLTDKANANFLVVPKKSYQRRSDLMDPTKFLDECENL